MFISSSLTEGNGSEPVPGVPAELFRFPLPIPGLVAATAPAALPASTLIPLCDDAVLLNFHRLPPSSLSLALLSFLCLSASRCAALFHPEGLNEPRRISGRVGAFEAREPVAAHMPGGGLASINLIDAARRRLVVEATDAFVEVRARLLGVAGEEGGCEFGL